MRRGDGGLASGHIVPEPPGLGVPLGPLRAGGLRRLRGRSRPPLEPRRLVTESGRLGLGGLHALVGARGRLLPRRRELAFEACLASLGGLERGLELARPLLQLPAHPVQLGRGGPRRVPPPPPPAPPAAPAPLG